MLTTPSQDSPVSNALALIGAWLRETGYSFTTVTPATHARVNSRQGCEQARSVRDIFGWSRPFDAALLPGEVLQWMGDAGLLETSPAG
ncbi:MAG: SAM-dependent methyltransferase, partial [Haliea sp.]